MYEKDGKEYFVVDGHVHYWDASPENRNKYCEGFINCYYDYHKNLSPEEWVWPKEKYDNYSEEDMMHDLFETGYVDVAIFQPTYLTEFFPHGFNTTEQNAVLKEKYPDKFILNGSFDPREGVQGLEQFEELVDKYTLKGVKLYTAEWKGDSKGWKLSDPSATKYLEKCVELGVKNIHVHKGPTIWPLNRDAFDVADVDEAASEFPDLRFIVEHVGLPRLDDFCWIGTQEPNVYGGLAVAMPFIHTRPRYFATIIGELLYWLGEDRLLFASDYAIWSPKWLVEEIVDLQMPESGEYEDFSELTPEIKRKILGLNAAKLYDIEVPEELRVEHAGTGPAVVSRQERLCRTLISEGHSPQELAAMGLGEMAPPQDLEKYLERRKELGLDASEEAPLVVDPEGNRVPEEAVIEHLRFAKTVGVSIDGNAGLCRGLLDVRYGGARGVGQKEEATL